jgi:16S rRNA (guanine527-N7)-methyltransferase
MEAVLTPADVDAQLRAAGVGQRQQETAALTRFLTLLRQWNRVYNLTGVRSDRELVARHLVESLALAPLLRGDRIADVGSGGGLPGVPLAICEPQRKFTLIESRAKRVRFLRHVIATLGLRNATVAHSRAEDLPAAPPFDTVLARAVARPAELLGIVRPLTAPGSAVVLLTSAELARRFTGLAEDFVVRSVGVADPAGAGRLPIVRSSVVVLERTQAH